MKKFVNGPFEEWGWSTGAQHEKDQTYFAAFEKRVLAAAQTVGEKEKIVCYYNDLKNAIFKERHLFKSQLENEFRLNDVKTVTGLRYNKTIKTFYARLQWQKERPEKMYKVKGKKVIPTEPKSDDIEVSEDWVMNQPGLEDDVIQYIIDFDRENGFIQSLLTSKSNSMTKQ